MATDQPQPLHKRFTVGEVFPASDPLAVWICTLSIALNDLIHSHKKVEGAQPGWERMYEWRVAVSHYGEACLHLERGQQMPDVVAFVESDPKLRALHQEALQKYESLRCIVHRVRNEAEFHYAYGSGVSAVVSALELQRDDEGSFGSTTGEPKLGALRMYFADEVAAELVLQAAGGSLEAYQEAMTDLAVAVAAFARFAHDAIDLYFYEHRDALRDG